MPKSVTRAMPSNPTSTLCGEMSRWTSDSGVPSVATRSCAACKPERCVVSDSQRDLERDRLAVIERALDDLARRHAVHVVHHQKRALVVFAEVDHADHVRVTDQTGDPGLVEEHRPDLGILAQVLVQAFDRTKPEKRALATHRQIDPAHSTGGQRA